MASIVANSYPKVCTIKMTNTVCDKAVKIWHSVHFTVFFFLKWAFFNVIVWSS